MTTHASTRTRPIKVTDATFAFDVLRAEGPVLVEFSAYWCGACQRLAPVIDELADDYAGRITIATLDVDNNPATTRRHGVLGIPSLLLFNGGAEQWRMVNVVRKAAIAQKLDETLETLGRLN